MQQYKAPSNYTIFDICLICYGTLDYLVKLMEDNNFEGVNATVESGQVFFHDESLKVL